MQDDLVVFVNRVSIVYICSFTYEMKDEVEESSCSEVVAHNRREWYRRSKVHSNIISIPQMESLKTARHVITRDRHRSYRASLQL